MSDYQLRLIPEDPRHVPDPTRQARARLEAIITGADRVECITYEKVRFFDCGGNFEGVSCPSCNEQLPQDWWGESMDTDHGDGGFHLAEYVTPCCGRPSTRTRGAPWRSWASEQGLANS